MASYVLRCRGAWQCERILLTRSMPCEFLVSQDKAGSVMGFAGIRFSSMTIA